MVRPRDTAQRLVELATTLGVATAEAMAVSEGVRDALEGEETKRQIVPSRKPPEPTSSHSK